MAAVLKDGSKKHMIGTSKVTHVKKKIDIKKKYNVLQNKEMTQAIHISQSYILCMSRREIRARQS